MRSVSLILFALLFVTPAAAADTTNAARQIVAELLEDTYEANTSEKLDEAAGAKAMKAAIGAAFAFDVWERFLVGDRGLDPSETGEFRRLLPGYLARLYAQNFGNFLAEPPRIEGTRSIRRDVLVSSKIPRGESGPLPVDYRVRIFDGRGPLVIDVLVGGVSFLVLKREEFAGLLDQGGPQRLLAFMRENSM